MATASTTARVKQRAKGRSLLWLGIGLCLLGLALTGVQVTLIKALRAPWYSPALATLGALVLCWSVAKRRSATRIVALGLVAVLAAFQWYFVGVMMQLPEYAGAAREGQKLPAFRTALADGRAFTEQDLADGTFSVLTFFRGRW
jgi:hypothetical protein